MLRQDLLRKAADAPQTLTGDDLSALAASYGEAVKTWAAERRGAALVPLQVKAQPPADASDAWPDAKDCSLEDGLAVLAARTPLRPTPIAIFEKLSRYTMAFIRDANAKALTRNERHEAAEAAIQALSDRILVLEAALAARDPVVR